MTNAEKILYHQIHPLKLAVDISTSVVTTIFLWMHESTEAASVAIAPSIIATLLLIRFADLDRLKNSAFGAYVRRTMSRGVEAQRLAGQVIAWIGAWGHAPLFIALGVLVIVLAWLSGVGRPEDA